MIPASNTLLKLVERLCVRAPETLELLTAETQEEYDAVLAKFIERGIRHLEENAKHFYGLREEGLSGALAAYLNMPGLRASQESNTNGHVDITIEFEHTSPLVRRLIEAKIYNSPSHHVGGLEQLLLRYTTGREGRGWLVNYVKRKNIRNLVFNLREHLNLTKPCHQTGKCRDYTIAWAFATKHRHSSGEEIEIAHISCNLFAGQT